MKSDYEERKIDDIFDKIVDLNVTEMKMLAEKIVETAEDVDSEKEGVNEQEMFFKTNRLLDLVCDLAYFPRR